MKNACLHLQSIFICLLFIMISGQKVVCMCVEESCLVFLFIWGVYLGTCVVNADWKVSSYLWTLWSEEKHGWFGRLSAANDTLIFGAKPETFLSSVSSTSKEGLPVSPLQADAVGLPWSIHVRDAQCLWQKAFCIWLKTIIIMKTFLVYWEFASIYVTNFSSNNNFTVFIQFQIQHCSVAKFPM